jgi:ribosome maturation factor RimP
MKPADYERFMGHEARLEVEPPIDGRKRFHGTIGAVEGDAVLLHTAGSVVSLPFQAIQRSKLVLTDRLIAAAQAEATIGRDAAVSAAEAH